MPLQPGTIIGPYEVLSAIGAGGMGEVYKARDTKLDRDVALKILPDAFVNDPERLARFQREAKVLASLNHPNIAAIYGLEESGDSPALVLEYVEGPTLQDRIANGPIPLDEALPIARQIAEALEAAHEQGIIHRDLKPANVKVKDDGTVKVLDFGLAKALAPELSDLDAANSPTMTMTAAATKMGVIMGTAAYMSPEQARAGTADRRSDIWAFGVVLLEMLTGQAPFTGKTVSDTLAFVLTKDPDWTTLAATTPTALRRLLRRCLEKDQRKRLPHIGSARLEIDDVSSEASDIAAVTTSLAPDRRGISWGVAATAVIVAGLLSFSVATWLRSAIPQPRVQRFAIPLPESEPLAAGMGIGLQGLAVAPDGSRLIYLTDDPDSGRLLVVREMGQSEVRRLPGTDGAISVFFSPDGQWVGFFTGLRDRGLTAQSGGAAVVQPLWTLKKVPVQGGLAVTLADRVMALGAAWRDDDTIVFGNPTLMQIPATGGTPELLIAPDENLSATPWQTGPIFVPGSDAILLSLIGVGQSLAAIHTPQSNETRILTPGVALGYLPSGLLLYGDPSSAQLGGSVTVMAAPFDLDRLELAGPGLPILESVRQAAGSANGLLAYVPGDPSSVARVRPVWVDRDGSEEEVPAEPHPYDYPRLSPDGTRLATNRTDADADVWIYDFTRRTSTRVTFGAAPEIAPLWSPDGARIAYYRGADVVWKAANGAGDEEILISHDNLAVPYAWSPDGSTILVNEVGLGVEGFGIAALDLTERTIESLLSSPFNILRPAIAPDGRWLAYQSDESGRFEVYVRPYPDVEAGLWQISTTGGASAAWSPDGRELFYRSGDAMMRVDIDASESFVPGTPEVLFEGRYYVGQGRSYDVAPDGRFLMLKETDDGAAGVTQIQVVLNWHQELLERVPVP